MVDELVGHEVDGGGNSNLRAGRGGRMPREGEGLLVTF